MNKQHAIRSAVILVSVMTALSACGEMSKLPPSASFGAKPTLPEPNSTLIPTVNIAPAQGWPVGVKPVSAAGTTVSADGKAYGRPVGVALDKQGALLVADDVGNVVWRERGSLSQDQKASKTK